MRWTRKSLIRFFLITALAAVSIHGQTAPEPHRTTQPEVSVENRQPADRSEKSPFLSPGNNEKDELIAPASGDDNDLIETDFARRQERRRIVDRERIKSSQSTFDRLLFTPFRAVSPFIRRGLTKFENDREFNRFAVFLSNPSIRPTVGGLGENSGFGAGIFFSTADKLSKNFSFFASGQATFKNYVETLAGIEIAPQKWAKGKVRLNLTGRFLIRPSELFFGSGANSLRGDRTSYFRRERGARFEASRQFSESLQIGAFADFSHNSVTGGKDSASPPITGKFPELKAFGFTRAARLLESGVFARYDRRDFADYPRAGFYLKLAASSADGLGAGNDFGYFNYDIDARAYVPVGSKNRTLALRFLGSFKDQKGNSVVPFFRLAKLGDSETLRGYESHRFQGINSVHLNIEYRFKLVQGIQTVGFRGADAIFFTDLGQVFHRKEELSINNLRATWGGGLQLIWGKGVGMSLLYAKSPEKGRLIVRFGKTF